MQEEFNLLKDSVRNTYGHVVWSHKIQEKQADIISGQHKRIVVSSIIFSSITSAGLLSIVFVDEYWIKVTSAIISFISATLVAFSNRFDLSKDVKLHKGAAAEYLSLRDRLKLLLLKIELHRDSFEELKGEYENLVSSVIDTDTRAPQTTDNAVRRAGKALHTNKDNEITDAEIDAALPRLLKKEHSDDGTGSTSTGNN
jgi:hypothetical protein